jgi:hypothetical protein
MVDERQSTQTSLGPVRRRRRWWWRALRVALVLIVLACVALGVAYRFRNELVAPLLIDLVAQRVERESGLVLTIDAVDGDWTHGLSLSGVSLVARDEKPQVRRLTVAHVELEYELRRLLRGELEGLTNIAVDGVVAHIDLARPSAPSTRTGSSSALHLPSTWPSFSLTGLDVDLILDAQRTVRLAGGSLQVGLEAPEESAASSNRAVLNVDSVVLDAWPGSPALVEKVHGLFGYRDGLVNVRELALTGDRAVHVAQSRLDLRALGSGELAWHADIEAFGGRVRGDGSTRAGELALSVDIAGVELDDVWKVIDPSAHAIPQARVDLRGDVGEKRGEWSGSATLLAREICVENRALDSIACDLALRPDGIDLQRLDARQGANALFGEALTIPFGAADWLATLRASHGRIALDLHDFTALTNGQAARVPLHHLHLGGVLDTSGIELTSGSFATASGELTVRRGRMQWGPSVESLLVDSPFDLDLTADFSDLADFGPIFSTEAWLGSARGSAHVSGTAHQPVGDLDLVGRGVTALGFELGDVAVRAHVDRERAHVQSLTADGPYGRFEVAGDYDIAERSVEHAHGTASTTRLADLWPELFKSGAAEIEVDCAGSLRDPTGTFELHARDLALSSGPPLSKLDLIGSHVGQVLRVESADAQLERVVLHTSGELRHDDWKMPLTVSVEKLEVEREGLGLALVAPADFRLEGAALSLHDVQLAGSAGKLRADVEFGDGNLDLSLHCDELSPMPLLAPFVPQGFALAHARGEFELTRAPGTLALDADFSVDGLRFAESAPELVLDCRGRFDGARATFDVLEMHASDGAFVSFSGDVPIDPFAEQPLTDGALRLGGTLSLPSIEAMPWSALGLSNGFRGSVAGDLVLDGSWRALRGSLELAARDVRERMEAGHSTSADNMLGPLDLDARVALDRAVTLEHCAIRSPEQLQCDLAGRYELGGDVVALIARGAQAWREAPLELHASLVAGDLTFLAAMVNARVRTDAQPEPVLRRTGGALTGECEIKGSIDAPELSGALHLEQGEIRLESALPAFERMSGDVHLEGSSLVLDSLRGDFGAGAFESHGKVDFHGGQANFDLTLDGRDIALVQQRGLRVRAASALRITGPLSQLHTSGKFTLTDGRWTERYDYLSVLNKRAAPAPSQSTWFSLRTEPFASMTFDVAIGAERAFRVDNNLARAALQPNLHLGGTGLEPQLSGDITLEPSRFSLPSGYLDLLTGTITLSESEPRRPSLHLQLQTRLRGYDLSLDVSGRFDDPVIVITSDPPLSNADAWQLVLTGQSPATSSASASGAEAAEAVAVFLGKDLVASWFGGDSDGAESLMDRIEWQTGTDVTSNGGSTVQVKLRVAGPGQGPGRALYLRGERDIYDRINYGLRVVFRFR